MSKRKSTFVALVIALMLITIYVCMFFLFRPAFIALTGAAAIYGYIKGSYDLRSWLSKETPKAHVAAKPGPAREDPDLTPENYQFEDLLAEISTGEKYHY